MMEQPSKGWALGTTSLLRHAVYEHYRAHQGQSPKRFVLHPAVVDALFSEMTIHESIASGAIKGFQNIKFDGVPIEIDPLAIRPKLITCRNVVEYL